jgi:membrane protein
MRLFGRLGRFFRRELWVVDLAALPRFKRVGFKLLRLSIVAVSEFQETALSFRAMGLVYTTILSLVPFLAVIFFVLKAFGIHHQIEPFLSQTLAPLGVQGEQITLQIMDFVSNLKVGILGALGVVGLFLTTVLLIDQIENALNAVWRVRRSRPLARKFSDYLSVVLVGPILVFTAFALIASAQSHWLVQRLLTMEPFGYLVILAAKIMPLIFLWIAFSFLYKLVPHTQVRLISAMVGGLTAAVLWQLASAIFATFVASSARYTALYSGFAILILFLMWLYVGWVIVLAGGQVAYYHQHPYAYMTRLSWKRAGLAVHERHTLEALLLITQRYLMGHKPWGVSELALVLNLPPAILEDFFEEFLRSGILYRVSEPEGIALGSHRKVLRSVMSWT